MVRFTHPTAPPHIPISPLPPCRSLRGPTPGQRQGASAAKAIKARVDGSGTAERLLPGPADPTVWL